MIGSDVRHMSIPHRASDLNVEKRAFPVHKNDFFLTGAPAAASMPDSDDNFMWQHSSFINLASIKIDTRLL